ncbi:MAG: tripartite tricarboxylate transporter substrate binding protein [Peptococcaceae bacterium]
MLKKVFAVFLIILVSLSLTAGCGQQQPAPAPGSDEQKVEYPVKDIEVIVPFSAGGGSDTTARLFSKILVDEEIVPVNINVINKPGGSAAIGMSYTAAKKGDPYYLMLITPSFLTTPLQGGVGVSYQDFTPIALLGFDDYFIVAKTGGDFNSLEDLLEAAQANPGGIRVGGASKGSGDHIVIERLADKAGVKFNYVPFQGGSEIITAILGGHIEAGILNVSETASFIEAGQLAALVTPGEKRIDLFPDVPTLTEKGIDIEAAMPRGVVAPGDIPPEVTEFLGNAFKQVCETEAWQQEYVDKFLFTSNYKNPEETAEYFEETSAVFAEYLIKLGVINK